MGINAEYMGAMEDLWKQLEDTDGDKTFILLHNDCGEEVEYTPREGTKCRNMFTRCPCLNTLLRVNGGNFKMVKYVHKFWKSVRSARVGAPIKGPNPGTAMGNTFMPTCQACVRQSARLKHDEECPRRRQNKRKRQEQGTEITRPSPDKRPRQEPGTALAAGLGEIGNVSFEDLIF